jgi:L-threonylcarbamoyladenylate synthase
MPSLSQPQAISMTEIQQAARILKSGGLIAFPTETVYGLGADAENTDALAKLYAAKGRPVNHPVIVHLACKDQLVDWAKEIPKEALALADAFWPGPLTLILKKADKVPDAVTGGQSTVGIRVPDHPVTLALLKAFGGGMAGPSANRFGRLSPTTAAHVRDDLGQDVDFVLEGGACQVGVESTIVAFRDGLPVVLRPGMITAEQIQAVLASAVSLESQKKTGEGSGSTVSRAPGTLASHYAPRTPTRLLSAEALRDLPTDAKIGVLAFSRKPESLQNVDWVVMPTNPDAYAQLLYGKLRELDAAGLSEIWVEQVPDESCWFAVKDRLSRAAFRV